MDDALLVRRLERLGNLPRNRQGFIHWNRTAHQSLRQVLAFDQLHHDGTNPAALLETVDVCDVRMVQRGERLRLTREPRQAIAIRRTARARS